MIFAALLATCSSWALFVGGHQFLKHQLCKGVHHEIDPLVSTLFAGTFALSAGLLLLVAYEILGLVDESFLRAHWRFNLCCVVALLLGVLPFVHLHRLFTDPSALDPREPPRRRRQSTSSSSGPFVVSAIRHSRAETPRPPPRVSSAYSPSPRRSRGWASSASPCSPSCRDSGAVHFPYSSISLFARHVGDAETVALERRLVQATETVVGRRKSRRFFGASSERTRTEARESGVSRPSPFWRRCGDLGAATRSAQASGLRLRLQAVGAEVEAMDHVVRSLHAELHEVRRARDRAAESRTTWGRMKNAGGGSSCR